MNTKKQGVKRPVIITRPDGSEIEYCSQSRAAQVEPLFQTDLSSMCNGYKKQVKGYKARFKDED